MSAIRQRRYRRRKALMGMYEHSVARLIVGEREHDVILRAIDAAANDGSTDEAFVYKVVLDVVITMAAIAAVRDAVKRVGVG